MRKHLALSGLLAGMGLLILGAAAMAAGGFGAPGTYHFSDTNASAALNDSAGASIFLNVDRGMQTFKPRGVSGPPQMMGPETVLSFSGFDASGAGLFGCFVIPDSSFTVAPGLASARLKVDPSQETACPGQLVSAGGGGRLGLAGPVPDAGGGGGGGGTPITADITWTSNGAVTSFTFTNTSRCQGAKSPAAGGSQSTFASVAGSVSLLKDISSSPFSQIAQFDNVQVITGTFSAACTGAK